VTLKTGILSKGASSPQIPTPSVYAPHPCHSVFECTARKYTVPYRIVSYAVITLPQGFFTVEQRKTERNCCNRLRARHSTVYCPVPDAADEATNTSTDNAALPKSHATKATSQVRLNTIPSRLGGDYKLKNHWRASYVLLSRTNLVVRVE